MTRFLVQRLTHDASIGASWTAECNTLEDAKVQADKVWGTPAEGGRQSIIDEETYQEWCRSDGDPEWCLANLGAPTSVLRTTSAHEFV